MTYENILTRVEGRAGIVTLNRPKALNALNRELMTELKDALAAMFALFFTFEIAVVGAIPLLTEIVPSARVAVMSMAFGAMAAGRTIGSVIGPFIWQRAGLPGNATVAALMMVLAVVVLFRWLHEGTTTSSETSEVAG